MLSSIYEKAEIDSELIPIGIQKFCDIKPLLIELGVFENGGVFLFDSDNTARNSLHDRETIDHFWKLDRLPDETINLLEELKSMGWQRAVITNQPIEGHQIGRAIAKIGKYPNAFEYYKTLENIFGYRPQIPGTGPIDLPFGVLSRHKYKDAPKAVDNISEWVCSNPLNISKTVVWVGNTEDDMVFGEKLYAKLRECEFQGKFILIKLRDIKTRTERAIRSLNPLSK